MKMERKTNINSVRKEMLIEFMKAHEDLQSGRFSQKFTFKTAQSLWEEITIKLNSVPNGADKDWRQWRKTWQDLKKHTKSKAVSVKKYAAGTGGGPAVATNQQLTELDNDILQLINPIQIKGLNMQETPLAFNIQSGKYIECGTDIEITEAMKENINEINQEDSECIYDSVCSTAVEEEAIKDNKPSTSRSVWEHKSYVIPAKKQKKMNKTKRLEKSINIGNCLINSVNTRNDIMEKYYKEKIYIVKNHSALFERTAKAIEKASDAVEKCAAVMADITNTLKNGSHIE